MSAEGLTIESTGGHRPPLQKIVLGTRGSELARAQTGMVEGALRAAWPGAEIEIEIITTRGDEKASPPNVAVDPKAGRKGVFTREIERALQSGKIDVAVHSAKDLPSEATPGLEIRATLPRAPVDDVLITKTVKNFAALPYRASIATSSVRRQHQLRWKRPDIHAVDLRGNVPTRLRKLIANDWDGIILARAGLERLGLKPMQNVIEFEDRQFVGELLPLEIFLPAGGQGIIALQIRSNDQSMGVMVEVVNDREALLCLRAEREFLRLLQGDCRSPVGVSATIEGASMKIHAQVFDLEAMTPRKAMVEGPSEDPETLAAKLFRRINGG
jgi:hydroxymethylbilane synthase